MRHDTYQLSIKHIISQFHYWYLTTDFFLCLTLLFFLQPLIRTVDNNKSTNTSTSFFCENREFEPSTPVSFSPVSSSHHYKGSTYNLCFVPASPDLLAPAEVYPQAPHVSNKSFLKLSQQVQCQQPLQRNHLSGNVYLNSSN